MREQITFVLNSRKKVATDFCNPFAKRDCFLDIDHFVYVDKYKKTSYYIKLYTVSHIVHITVGLMWKGLTLKAPRKKCI